MKDSSRWGPWAVVLIIVAVVCIHAWGCSKVSYVAAPPKPDSTLEGNWRAEAPLRGGDVQSETLWGFEGDRFAVWQVVLASQDSTGLLEPGRTLYEAQGTCQDLSAPSTHCLREHGIAYRLTDGEYVALPQSVFHLEAIVFPEQGIASIQGRVYERVEMGQ